MAKPEHAVVALVVAILSMGGCTCARSASRDGQEAGAPAVTADPSTTTTDARADLIDRDAAVATPGATNALDDGDGARVILLPGGPLLTIRTIGAALIEVTLAEGTPTSDRWKRIEIERRPLNADASADGIQHDSFEKPQRGGGRWRPHLHAATHGMTYGYRARFSGAWSSEVTLRVPDPSAPPPAPTSLTARPESPFAAHLSWASSARGTAGFEIQVKLGDDFVRAALVDPTEHEFVHHLRLPGPVAYRVRSFNARGASAQSPVVSVTLPERVDSPGAKQAPMGPCVAPVLKAPKSAGCNPEISTLDGENGHVVSNVPGAGSGCSRHLMGNYAGCTREFGVFVLQADVVVVPGRSDEGWPLLHAVAGAGQYVGAQIQTLQFARGRYTIADEGLICGEPFPDANPLTTGTVNDDLAKCGPPFESCQHGPFSF